MYTTAKRCKPSNVQKASHTNTGKAKHKCTYQCRTCVILYQGTKTPDPRTVPISSMRCSACLPSPCNTNLCAAPALLHIIHAACTPESRSATLSYMPRAHQSHGLPRYHVSHIDYISCKSPSQHAIQLNRRPLGGHQEVSTDAGHSWEGGARSASWRVSWQSAISSAPT